MSETRLPHVEGWKYTSMPSSRGAALLIAFLFAGFCVAIGWLVESHYGLNIWDEGFLWYGAQRVAAGEVPIRDFMAYDPGRYYWVAGITKLLHVQGILGIRVAVALFQWVGLAVALWMVVRSTTRRQLLFVVIAAITLWMWMFPRHKLFDISLSIMLVGLVAWWWERPDSRRHLGLGIALGLVACFGRNHGAYGFVGCLLAFAWMAVAKRGLPSTTHLAAWIAGLCLGFAPIWVACLFVRGFAAAFWESIAFLFEVKTTNLPLPIPWPWLVSSALPWDAQVRYLLVGVCFAALLLYPVAAAFVLWRRRARGESFDGALVATVCLAVPYAHYAFSRADVGHLAQAIFPCLIGCILFLSGAPLVRRGVGLACMSFASAWVVSPSHPIVPCITSGLCKDVTIGDDHLMLDPATASDIGLIHQLVSNYAPRGRAFITTPYWPGAYALMNQRSPLWEIYATPPRTEAFQRQEIARLQAADPGFVLILEFPLDNRDELRYSRTHPVMFKYVQEHFLSVPSPNPNYLIFRAPDTSAVGSG